MSKSSKRRIAFISSFLPRKCGIATFCTDVIRNVKSAAGSSFEPLVVAMQGAEEQKYEDPVKFEIRRNVKNDYICAAEYINFSHVDAVSLQHEFGLYGGNAGNFINLFLERVNAPVITTMHTVLEEPNSDYYKSTVELCDASHKIIVMNRRGIDMLRDIYGVPTSKIELVPHGIPDLPFVDSSYYKHKFGMTGRKTILTFGLLGRNKGIEIMLEALPYIAQVDPNILYIVLGRTHPEVLRTEGEAYRFKLQRMVKDLNIQNNVIFHNRFVNDEELHNFLCASDIYVTPYLHKEQLTSGTLAFAVGTGKAVVSTPYWAAEELLDENRGRLVNFNDPKDLAKSIIEILKDEPSFLSLRRQAYDYGRDITWPKIGKRYWKLFTCPSLPISMPISTKPAIDHSIAALEIPEPPLDHIKRLTDSTGIFQHAKFIIPDRNHGYCTDDNARALIVMTKYLSQYTCPQAMELFDIYLSFVCHSQRSDGMVRNFMTFNRKWLENEPAHDSLGRALWAFGTVMANPPSPTYLSIIKDLFDKSVQHVTDISIRGKAYAIFGLVDYLKQFPGASEIKRHLCQASDAIYYHFKENATKDWEWFEDILAYDNAVLPNALIAAGMAMENQEYIKTGLKTCEFLIKNTYTGTHFSFVGCKGWYKRRGSRAKFDQQPLEVVSTILMLKSAYEATGLKRYLELQKKAFDWFLGDNDLQIPVYDFQTKGCYDGLERGGVNLNQGAESMISFMTSLLCIIESCKANIDETQKSLFPLDFVEEKPRFQIADLTFEHEKSILSAQNQTLDVTKL